MYDVAVRVVMRVLMRVQVAEAKKVAPKFGTLVSEPSQLRKEAEEKNELLRKGSSTGDVGSSFTSSSSSIVTHHKPAESTQLQIETAMYAFALLFE